MKVEHPECDLVMVLTSRDLPTVSQMNPLLNPTLCVF